MKSLSTILDETKNINRPKNLSKEFQYFGVYLTEELGDLKHYSLYMKLAKDYPRALLEEALAFTKGYTMAKSRPKVFMWKLKELRNTQ